MSLNNEQQSIIRWDRIRVADLVHLDPKPPMRVISREYNPQSKLWFLGFLRDNGTIWKVGYVGHHEEKVSVYNKHVGKFFEEELCLWIQYAHALRDLLFEQNKRLYDAAKDKCMLLHSQK